MPFRATNMPEDWTAGPLSCSCSACSAVQAQTPAEIDAALKAAFTKYQRLKEGANADYIPALAKVDPNLFGHRSGDR